MIPVSPRLLLGLGVLLIAWTTPTVAQRPASASPDAPELFEHLADDGPGATHLRREALETVAAGSSLRLNLQPDAAARSAHVSAVSATPLGGRVIRGQVDGQPAGSFLVVQHGAATVGNFSVSPTEQYTIEGETVRVQTASINARCACVGDPRTLRRGLHLARQADTATIAGYPAQFDVLIVYTAAAQAAEGSVDALTAQAELAMADANACYESSGVNIQGRIVGVRAVDYVESGEISTDLDHLVVPDDGVLDEVQGYRDEAQADFVCMFTRRDSADGYAGYAKILTDLTPDNETLGFSVADVKEATIEHLFAHELGHNMGCDHDHENATGYHLYDFSYGLRFTGLDGVLYRDVMAYAPGASVGIFGSPGIVYQGVPTGVAGYADTARTLNLSAPAFIHFREADGRARVSVGPGFLSLPVKGAFDPPTLFAFERTGSVAQPLDVRYQIGGTAVAGVNYEMLPGVVHFIAGAHIAVANLTPITNAPPFGEATVILALQPGDAYVAADSAVGAKTSATLAVYDRLPLISVGAVRRVGSAPGKFKVRVTCLGHTDSDLVVHYRVRGTAVADTDYRKPASPATVTIPAGQTSAVIKVRLLDGATQPGDLGRTVKIVLKAGAGYNVGAARTAGASL